MNLSFFLACLDQIGHYRNSMMFDKKSEFSKMLRVLVSTYFIGYKYTVKWFEQKF